ncbi:four helix bundle protein [Leptodesmis sichuanensis]|uniref:four helix bundle protein n=1 Tax=Leptodesmis sichuanensis TaxID=2906798 RepID=UPI001F449E37|nr:four helix bundle protein [Leptodesmis sichuanensis]UIE38766.1 four helix bundle protein [Leptodesmis sichuanensis A121]
MLELYELTKQFAVEQRYRLVDQICRAAASVPTNIAEGKGRGSTKEYIHFLIMARGSTEETKYLLLLARDLHYLQNAKYLELTSEYSQVSRILNGLISALKQKA